MAFSLKDGLVQFQAMADLLVLPDLRASAYPLATGPGLVVSILAGVNADGSPNMTLAGQWFRVAQQVSLGSDNTLELLMEDSLPAMPQGGYYVIEVTAGFVNNAITNNTLDLSGKSSTGVVFNGDDYGTTVVGNDFLGGTTYDNVYTGTAISMGATINSAPSGSGQFPLPAGWTALPNLGVVITGNTIEDSLGGILIGVQHSEDYWGAEIGSTSLTGRVFITASVIDNTFKFDTAFLISWTGDYVADGNNPAESSTPPTISIGSGFSAEAPGPHGSPRFPWTVGSAIRVNGTDVPIFVDPTENVVTVESNSVSLVAANGTITPSSGWSGQVYAAIVIGVTIAPANVEETYNNQPYYAFNLKNLNVSTAPPDPPPPPPPPAPAPSPPLSPSGLSVVLIGLNSIGVSWNASAGASSYVLERSVDQNSWSVIGSALTATSFVDVNLSYSMIYYYRVFGVSSAGSSPSSVVVGAVTKALPDVLSGQSLIVNATRGQLFIGPVATFTDQNVQAASGQFVATITWGNGHHSQGTVTGSNGTFTVSGNQTFARVGTYDVQITVTMTEPDVAGVVVNSTAQVSIPPKRRPVARPARVARVRVARALTKRVAAVRRRARNG